MKEFKYLSGPLPPDLTAEEVKLKETWEKLKQLKKETQAAKASVAQKQDSGGGPQKRQVIKRSVDDATEEAKRKVISGAMKIDKVQEKSTFKRTKVERKRTDSTNEQTSVDHLIHSPPPIPVPLRDTVAQRPHSTRWVDTRRPPQQQHTGPPSKRIKIRGFDLTEDGLRNAFSSHGQIVNFFLDDRRKHATIEFSKQSEAQTAKNEMHLSLFNGNEIRVEFDHSESRGMRAPYRPPQNFVPANYAPEDAKAGAGTSRQQHDGRTMIKYDEDDTF